MLVAVVDSWAGVFEAEEAQNRPFDFKPPDSAKVAEGASHRIPICTAPKSALCFEGEDAVEVGNVGFYGVEVHLGWFPKKRSWFGKGDLIGVRKGVVPFDAIGYDGI